MRILITGGKSATALKLLKAFIGHDVILADYGDVPSFSSANYTFKSLGIKNIDTLAHTLLNNCLDESIDAILPLQHFEIEPLLKAEVLFNEFNINLLLPNRDVINEYDSLNTINDNWVVFYKGDALFTTLIDDTILAFGKQKLLSGAYYFDEHKQLSLITITGI